MKSLFITFLALGLASAGIVTDQPVAIERGLNRTVNSNSTNQSSNTTQITVGNQKFVLSFGKVSYKKLDLRNLQKRTSAPSAGNSASRSSVWEYMAENLPKNKEALPALTRKIAPSQIKAPQQNGALRGKQAKSTSNKDEVRSEILQWWTDPIGGNLQQSTNILSESVTFENQTTKCTTRKIEYSRPSYLTMNIDQPTNVLFPGGFVQGKSIKTGAEPLQRIPVGTVDRFPIQISNTNGYYGDSAPTADAVMNFIRKILRAQQNDVWLGFVQSKDLKTAFEAMNFNNRVAEKLGITNAKGERIYVFMQQLIDQYYPAMVAQDDSWIEDPIGVFFKDSFDIVKALGLKNLLFWGEKNIPCYINRVYFGRFLAVSVEANKKNREIYESITTSSLGTDQTTQKLKEMFSDPSILAYGKSLFSEVETQLIKTGNWDSFFGDIEISPQNLKKLSPLVYSINDFRDQPVQFSNAITFPATQCVAKPKPPQSKVFVQLINVYDYAYLQVKPSGQGFYTVYERGEGTSHVIDISGYLTNDPQANDEIRIINTVEKKCWLCQYHRQVILNVWFDTVDGAHLAYSDQELCTACHSSDDAIRCNINKVKKTINCWKS